MAVSAHFPSKSGLSANNDIADMQKFAHNPNEMPFYRFMIHGRDPRHPEDVRGFFTARHAFAPTQEKAAKKILSKLAHEFTVGESALIWKSDRPVMSIEDGWRIGFREFLSATNKGSTFYEP